MKQAIAVFLLLAGSIVSYGQASFATVTGTVVDGHSNPYAYARLSATLVSATGVPLKYVYFADGSRYVVPPLNATLGSDGAFSVSVLKNSSVANPTGTKWQFAIGDPNQPGVVLTYSPSWSITYSASITANVSLSTPLNALAQNLTFVNLQSGQNTIANGAGNISGTLTAGKYPVASDTHTLVDGVITNNAGEFGIIGAIDDDVSITARGDTNGYFYNSACNSNGTTCSSTEFDPPLQGGNMFFSATGSGASLFLNANNVTGFRVTPRGLETTGTAPAASAGSLATGSNNNTGEVTGLTTATTVTLTFANAGFLTQAFCVANPSVALTTAPYVSGISKTAVTFTFSSLTGGLFYHCDGN